MPFDRAATLAWLRTSPDVPVLIVGGGINGAGVLRELALEGIDALLVDRADFASGATSASSRMIHGGLRYLENGEFRLVREALHERNRLLRNAPHCVHPLQTVIPLFTRLSGLGNSARKFLRLGGKPARRGAWLVRFGISLYERFAGRDNPLPRRRHASGNEARRERPALHPGVIATSTYFDAWNPAPERLCLEVIDDALRAHAGVRATNYVSLVAATDTGSEATRTVTLRDEVSGETFRVRPAIVVNAGGAWIDAVHAQFGLRTECIGGTKGSHLVVEHPELFAATGGSEIFYENKDGRICLFFPINGRVLVGTTDIRIDNPDDAVCDDAEVAYLAAAVREVFPSIEIRPEHVVSRFSGVRPLPRSTTGFTGQISRDHDCREMPPDATRAFPIFALVSGKWTTFRALSEQTADRLVARLGGTRRADSRNLAIGGGRTFPQTPQEREQWIERVAGERALPRKIVAGLFERHGTHAEMIAAHIAPLGTRALASIGPLLEGELDFIARRESIVHLDDLVLRRTILALFGHLDRARLARVAAIAADALGWDAKRVREEILRCREILTTRHGVDLDRVVAAGRSA